MAIPENCFSDFHLGGQWSLYFHDLDLCVSWEPICCNSDRLALVEIAVGHFYQE